MEFLFILISLQKTKDPHSLSSKEKKLLHKNLFCEKVQGNARITTLGWKLFWEFLGGCEGESETSGFILLLWRDRLASSSSVFVCGWLIVCLGPAAVSCLPSALHEFPLSFIERIPLQLLNMVWNRRGLRFRGCIQASTVQSCFSVLAASLYQDITVLNAFHPQLNAERPW